MLIEEPTQSMTVAPARQRRPTRRGRRREGDLSARKPQIASEAVSGRDCKGEGAGCTGCSEESAAIDGEEDGDPVLDCMDGSAMYTSSPNWKAEQYHLPLGLQPGLTRRME